MSAALLIIIIRVQRGSGYMWRSGGEWTWLQSGGGAAMEWRWSFYGVEVELLWSGGGAGYGVEVEPLWSGGGAGG